LRQEPSSRLRERVKEALGELREPGGGRDRGGGCREGGRIAGGRSAGLKPPLL
jgi:hypothetical protein